VWQQCSLLATSHINEKCAPSLRGKTHFCKWMHRGSFFREANRTRSLPASAAAAPSAIATIAASSAATAASASTTAAAPFRLRTSFIDIECAAAKLRSVQSRDGLFPVFVVSHFDESEAARTTGIPVRHNSYSIHLSILLEHLT
jgi:hypothetical protein